MPPGRALSGGSGDWAGPACYPSRNTTAPNREDKPGQPPNRTVVRAEIRADVKRVLRKREVREADFEPFIARFIQQAEAQYAEWPLVA